MWRKALSDRERVNLRTLLDAGVDLPIVGLRENVLYLRKGSAPEVDDLAPERIVATYGSVIAGLQEIRSDSFTEGYYKYISPESPGHVVGTMREYYNQMLAWAMRIRKLEHGTTTLGYSEEAGILERIGQMICRIEIKEGPQPYCLLHGDLHPGNIIAVDGRYYPIDFEHLRFGLRWPELHNFMITSVKYLSKDLVEATIPFERYAPYHSVFVHDVGSVREAHIVAGIGLLVEASLGRLRGEERWASSCSDWLQRLDEHHNRSPQ